LTEAGFTWLGVDISAPMLKQAKEFMEVEGDVILSDMGAGLPFTPGAFDGAISISAIQWLCNSNKSDERPAHRLLVFFQSLFACLVSYFLDNLIIFLRQAEHEPFFNSIQKIQLKQNLFVISLSVPDLTVDLSLIFRKAKRTKRYI
jgi:hypothetical protein